MLSTGLPRARLHCTGSCGGSARAQSGLQSLAVGRTSDQGCTLWASLSLLEVLWLCRGSPGLELSSRDQHRRAVWHWTLARGLERSPLLSDLLSVGESPQTRSYLTTCTLTWLWGPEPQRPPRRDIKAP